MKHGTQMSRRGGGYVGRRAKTPHCASVVRRLQDIECEIRREVNLEIMMLASKDILVYLGRSNCIDVEEGHPSKQAFSAI